MVSKNINSQSNFKLKFTENYRAQGNEALNRIWLVTWTLSCQTASRTAVVISDTWHSPYSFQQQGNTICCLALPQVWILLVLRWFSPQFHLLWTVSHWLLLPSVLLFSILRLGIRLPLENPWKWKVMDMIIGVKITFVAIRAKGAILKQISNSSRKYDFSKKPSWERTIK